MALKHPKLRKVVLNDSSFPSMLIFTYYSVIKRIHQSKTYINREQIYIKDFLNFGGYLSCTVPPKAHFLSKELTVFGGSNKG